MAAITLLNLDLSGRALANRIVGEPHTLIKVPRSPHRVIMLDRGGFYDNGRYDDSLKVYDATGRSLTKGVDFISTYFYDDFHKLSGKPVYGMIVVKNPEVSAQVKVDYQAVGGPFGLSVKELKLVMEEVAGENLTIKFSELVNKPTAYIPADHLNKWWQIYGMDSTVAMLNRIRDTIGFGEQAIIDDATGYGQILIDELNKLITDYANAANAHIGDRNNPHGVTKTQVGLSNLNNWGMASAGGSNFVLELRATKVQPADAVNSFVYEMFSNASVTIAAGDRLVYDLWQDSPLAMCGVDALSGRPTTDPAYSLRDFGVPGGPRSILRDQNGLNLHPGSTLNGRAVNQWYHREFDLTPCKGINFSKWNFAFEGEEPGTFTARLREVYILNSAGNIKATLFAGVLQFPAPYIVEGPSKYINVYKSVVNQASDINAYLSPGAAYQILAGTYIPLLASHIADKGNPHRVTAAQLSAYTRGQVVSVLSQYMDRDGTAVNSNAIGGVDYNGVAANTRINLPTGNVVSGVFNPARLGNGGGSIETLLCGDMTFRSIQQLFDYYDTPAANSIYIGRVNGWREAQNALNASFSDLNAFPIGTFAFANVYTTDIVGDIPSPGLVYGTTLEYWTRIASGWMRTSGQNHIPGNPGTTPTYD